MTKERYLELIQNWKNWIKENDPTCEHILIRHLISGADWRKGFADVTQNKRYHVPYYRAKLAISRLTIANEKDGVWTVWTDTYIKHNALEPFGLTTEELTELLDKVNRQGLPNKKPDTAYRD